MLPAEKWAELQQRTLKLGSLDFMLRNSLVFLRRGNTEVCLHSRVMQREVPLPGAGLSTVYLFIYF